MVAFSFRLEVVWKLIAGGWAVSASSTNNGAGREKLCIAVFPKSVVKNTPESKMQEHCPHVAADGDGDDEDCDEKYNHDDVKTTLTAMVIRMAMLTRMLMAMLLLIRLPVETLTIHLRFMVQQVL